MNDNYGGALKIHRPEGLNSGEAISEEPVQDLLREIEGGKAGAPRRQLRKTNDAKDVSLGGKKSACI